MECSRDRPPTSRTLPCNDWMLQFHGLVQGSASQSAEAPQPPPTFLKAGILHSIGTFFSQLTVTSEQATIPDIHMCGRARSTSSRDGCSHPASLTEPKAPAWGSSSRPPDRCPPPRYRPQVRPRGKNVRPCCFFCSREGKPAGAHAGRLRGSVGRSVGRWMPPCPARPGPARPGPAPAGPLPWPPTPRLCQPAPSNMSRTWRRANRNAAGARRRPIRRREKRGLEAPAGRGERQQRGGKGRAGRAHVLWGGLQAPACLALGGRDKARWEL